MQSIKQVLSQVRDGRHSPGTTPMPASDQAACRWTPSLDAYEPSLVAAARHAAEFVGAMAEGRPARWLTLAGAPGCGKTMIARLIFEAAKAHNPGELQSVWVTGTGYRETRDRRPRRVFIEATEFAERIRGGREFDLPDYLSHDFLVVFDDLGAVRDPSGFVAEAIYRFANARLGRWTVWTTNLSAEAVAAQIDPRVASRLLRGENIAHRITAGDYALARACRRSGQDAAAPAEPHPRGGKNNGLDKS
jgi:DNA replication protein DnaC